MWRRLCASRWHTRGSKDMWGFHSFCFLATLETWMASHWQDKTWVCLWPLPCSVKFKVSKFCPNLNLLLLLAISASHEPRFYALLIWTFTPGSIPDIGTLQSFLNRPCCYWPEATYYSSTVALPYLHRTYCIMNSNEKNWTPDEDSYIPIICIIRIDWTQVSQASLLIIVLCRCFFPNIKPLGGGHSTNGTLVKSTARPVLKRFSLLWGLIMVSADYIPPSGVATPTLSIL